MTPRPVPRSKWPASQKRARRKVDPIGNLSFAGVVYNVGRAWSGRLVEVFSARKVLHVVADDVVVRTHPVRHRPEKEPAALADVRRGG